MTAIEAAHEIDALPALAQQARPRIVLVTLNARYIHASLGLRYLLANLDTHGCAGLQAQCALREYTISRPTEEIVADLLHTLGPAQDGVVRVVGFGVYIWNVVQTHAVLQALRARRADLKIVLGGPEVSHETDDQAIVTLADHVITGWGDVSFAKLCRALLFGPPPLMKIIAGEQAALQTLALPYEHFSQSDLAHRVLYVEASRGCPFKCEFCLSALDKTAWAFDLDALLQALDALYQRGARQFKFVDRTFNLKIENASRILQFFLDKLSNTASDVQPAKALALHFEVIADHLPERLQDMLRQFPPGVLQLEIGIQTFNPAVQNTLSRRQDNAKALANLRWLLAHTQAHLHVDLIFGLPGEDLASFARGFDLLWEVKPQEIQLGVLKRLRGAPIARHTATHGMVYQLSPPYAVVQTALLDASTVAQFVRLARYWDLIANSGRFKQALALLLNRPGPTSAFWRFWQLSAFLWARLANTQGLTPEFLSEALLDYLCGCGLDGEQVKEVLLADYRASRAHNPPVFMRKRLRRLRSHPADLPAVGLARQARHLGLQQGT